jgi:hypothetical protein
VSHEDGRDHAPSLDKLAMGTGSPSITARRGRRTLPFDLSVGGHPTLPGAGVSSHPAPAERSSKEGTWAPATGRELRRGPPSRLLLRNLVRRLP